MTLSALSLLAVQSDQHMREAHKIVSTGIGMVLANMGEKAIEITADAVAEFARLYDVTTEKTTSGIVYRLVQKAPSDPLTKNMPI